MHTDKNSENNSAKFHAERREAFQCPVAAANQPAPSRRATLGRYIGGSLEQMLSQSLQLVSDRAGGARLVSKQKIPHRAKSALIASFPRAERRWNSRRHC